MKLIRDQQKYSQFCGIYPLQLVINSVFFIVINLVGEWING